MSPRPAVFLDRDGTIVEEAGYIDRLERLKLFPWSLDAVRLLNRGGFRVVVVTNQAGVAYGYFDEAFVRGVHDHLDAQLRASGAEVDGFYYCPHHPEAPLPEYRQPCDCRKPAPGLFLRAAREHDLDLARSYAVGDRWRDVEAARNAGVIPVLVRSGYGASEAAAGRSAPVPAHVADNLIGATTWILRQRGC
ncbi:MAG TPA: HAD-IIIA family hydrolase [Vicinamibacterales bacterium]|nr:HAD-IIIA family hydrolase [Vicinamibacterales bacterium]